MLKREGLKGCCFILLAVEGMKQNETPGIEGKRQASILLFLMHHKSGMQTLGGGILCAGTTCPQRMIDHEGKSRLADEQGRCAAPLLPTGELGDSGTSGPPRHSRRWRQGSSPLIVHSHHQEKDGSVRQNAMHNQSVTVSPRRRDHGRQYRLRQVCRSLSSRLSCIVVRSCPNMDVG